MNIIANLFCKFSTLFYGVVLVVLAIGLSGCEKLFQPSIKSICEDFPHYCADLNPDGWCRAEKSEIIRHRHLHHGNNEERPKYYLLVKYEHYNACISKASQIEHVKYREREFGRKEAAVSFNKSLKQLVWQTRNMEDPYISYYQWSRYNNQAAKERFVLAAKQGVFSEPKFYIDFASIAIDDDPETAKNALFTAISQYKNVDEEIDGSIASLLMSFYLENENYRMAYVWTAVTNHFANSATSISNSQLTALKTKYDLKTAILDRVSSDIIDAMEAKEFDAAALKIDKL